MDPGFPSPRLRPEDDFCAPWGSPCICFTIGALSGNGGYPRGTAFIPHSLFFFFSSELIFGGEPSQLQASLASVFRKGGFMCENNDPHIESVAAIQFLLSSASIRLCIRYKCPSELLRDTMEKKGNKTPPPIPFYWNKGKERNLYKAAFMFKKKRGKGRHTERDKRDFHLRDKGSGLPSPRLRPEDDFLRPMGQPLHLFHRRSSLWSGSGTDEDRKTGHRLQDSVKGYSEGITRRCILGIIFNAKKKVVWKIYVFSRSFF
ncbi:hypothetical protein CEXT_214001 [Caerostris extrusa]|uniref:Uncharacterized protein n=1 Tax=Caerostris extrusa TaxID=172846 RepID=A0AAV4P1W2_CAEEX|nr:hypothetical protein CEXT_214001 [Caerostris extrusa]